MSNDKLPAGQLTEEQMRALAAIGAAAYHAAKQPSVQGAIKAAVARATARAAAPVVTQRVISDKQAPIDEGEWEFRLVDGVLTVMAWNDAKTEFGCVRMVRRGVEIHLMHGEQAEAKE